MKSKQDARLRAMDLTLRALADPTRLRIVALLVSGEVCVCHIHEALKVPQPTASRHLAYLRRARLVETRKDGLWVHYRLASLNDTALQTLVDTTVHCAGHLETVTADRKRLEKATGCCVVGAMPEVTCCEAVSVR
jgi:ArsR family transcriptional regulator, arsenate/arsenite/antimonite-responsive transcriptional repressor